MKMPAVFSRRTIPALLAACLALPAFSEGLHADSYPNWPAWRGDLEGSGVIAGEPALPREWNTETNILWRIELPERGNSTPVVWEDRIFVTQAIDAENWRGLMCFKRADGELLWKSGLTYAEEERSHRDNPYCSASPATDGKIVVASYGSAGIACYDMEGKQLWHRDLGAIDHVWGNSASPLIVDQLVIHYHGPAENAVLYAFDRNTGETVWQYNEPVWQPGERTDGFQGRDGGVIGSFSTPVLIDEGERRALVMSFPMEMRAFDPASGETLWHCSGLNPLVYTSPVHDDGIVVAMGGYHGNSIGVRTGGSGDVTASHRLWQEIRHEGGIGSGVTRDGKLYFHNSGGVAFCLDMKTGATLWKDRLPGAGKSWGSFVLAGDLIYALSQAGDCVVFKASPDGFEEVALNELGEHTNSSVTPSGDRLLIRTYDALWCIGTE